HETSEQETREINQALLADPELQQQFQQLCATTQVLDEAQLQPSSQAVLAVIGYLRAQNAPVKH
ncbi:MAG: hypothetical protein ACK5X6_07575, partial [Chryseotalea sp.]